jgi:hypothetical protein
MTLFRRIFAAVAILPFLLVAPPAKASDDPRLVAAAQKAGFRMVTQAKAEIRRPGEGGIPQPYVDQGMKIGDFLLDPSNGLLYLAKRSPDGFNNIVAHVGEGGKWFFEQGDRLVKAGFNANGSKLCMIIASAGTRYKWGMSCYRRVNQGSAQDPWLVYVEDTETLGRMF